MPRAGLCGNMSRSPVPGRRCTVLDWRDEYYIYFVSWTTATLILRRTIHNKSKRARNNIKKEREQGVVRVGRLVMGNHQRGRPTFGGARRSQIKSALIYTHMHVCDANASSRETLLAQWTRFLPPPGTLISLFRFCNTRAQSTGVCPVQSAPRNCDQMLFPENAHIH